MILITGANGQTGRAVIEHLVDAGAPVRALASNPRSAAALGGLGAEPVVGNLRDRDSLAAAMRGCAKVFHICPRLQPDETEIGLRVIAAAEAAGVGHLVYHSVIHPHLESIAFHWAKMRVEAALMHSRLRFTILRPTNYMQNIDWTWGDILRTGRWELPYPADRLLSWLDRDDMGAAGARVLLDDRFAWGTYELSGTLPIGRAEMAAEISRALGRTVEAAEVPLEEFMAIPRYRNRPAEERERMRTMFCEYRSHGLRAGNPQTLSMILGRPATGYAAFANKFVAQKRAAGLA